MELSQEKTNITHVTQDKVHYLGFDISKRSRIYTESQNSYIKKIKTEGRVRTEDPVIPQ